MGRDTTKLKPELQKIIPEFLNRCRKNGLEVRITETYRTSEEQDTLYAQGRTIPGIIVTSCRGCDYASHHQWGTAFDFCRNDGRGAFDDSDGFFTKVGRIGERLGLEWGGSWTGFVDRPHLQLKQYGSTTKMLREKYGTPDNFKKIWAAYKAPNLADLSRDETTLYIKHLAAVKALQKAINDEQKRKFNITGHPTEKLLEACPGMDEKSTGKTVKALQQLLDVYGYDLKITGTYNAATQKAVIDFKQKKSITPGKNVKAGGKLWKKILMM